eukprot:TCONS_00055629-protein
MVASDVSFIVGITVAILVILGVCVCCCINPTCFYFQDVPGVPNKMKVRKRQTGDNNRPRQIKRKENNDEKTPENGHQKKQKSRNKKPKTFNQRSKPKKHFTTTDVERADEHLLNDVPPSYEETCLTEDKSVGSETSV